MSADADKPYASNDAHLQDELHWLDLLIRLRVQMLPLAGEAAPDSQLQRAAYITPQEVSWLLDTDAEPRRSAASGAMRSELMRLRAEIDRRVAHSLERGVPLALPRLCTLFGLSAFERQIVVVCLAPELRRKYDRLYAYLQDDITRKKPSVDLALDLLCETEPDRWKATQVLCDHAPLLRAGILQRIEDPHSPSGSSGLAQFIRLDPRVLGFLLGRPFVDSRLADFVQVQRPATAAGMVPQLIVSELVSLVRARLGEAASVSRMLAIYLHGPRGVGRRALAEAVCGELGRPLLMVDAEELIARAPSQADLLRTVFREGVLLQAAIYLDNAGSVLVDERRGVLRQLAMIASDYGSLVFLSGNKPWSPTGAFGDAVFHSVALAVPDALTRQRIWEARLSPHLADPAAWASELAAAFRMTSGQISDAVRFAAARAAAQRREAVSVADLYEGCRFHSNQKLGEMAAKITPRYGWDDLVLPSDTIVHLRQICVQARYRRRVLVDWGFARKLSHGKGLSALFYGPPGTGKTMAAQVIAAELQLDLYRIDLSAVVNKYIGETEKNLARIFHEAETSNAILFFDEADALFGRRTEIADAHDRYANLETSFLLQRIEDYEGIVVLATNLRENIDDAFTRRIRFMVEFPFPDEASRARLWRAHFPPEAPLKAPIDYEYLARRLKIAGGSIKNIVMNSAFLAAEQDGAIAMEHLLNGARREFEKIGKLWTEREASGPRPNGSAAG
jgi:ATP-dependent 26S proteasome regulatory subunit